MNCEFEVVIWPPLRLARMRCERGSATVVLPARSPLEHAFIGMDIHRVAAEVVVLHEGKVTKLGRVPMLSTTWSPSRKSSSPMIDHAMIEATGNASIVTDLLTPYVERVIVANPKHVRLIAHAKFKTDSIDAPMMIMW
jgi:transposase